MNKDKHIYLNSDCYREFCDKEYWKEFRIHDIADLAELHKNEDIYDTIKCIRLNLYDAKTDIDINIDRFPKALSVLYLSCYKRIINLPQLPKSLLGLEINYLWSGQDIGELPPNLLYIDISACINLRELPKSLKYIDITLHPDFKLYSLPTSLKSLSLNYSYIKTIDRIPKLPNYLRNIHIEGEYNLPLPELKNTRLRNITFVECEYTESYSSYNQELPKLPPSLKYIKFNTCYNKPLPEIKNTNLNGIIFGEDYNYPLPQLPNTIKYIRFGFYYNHPLPPLEHTNIRHILVGEKFNNKLGPFPLCFRSLFLYTHNYIKIPLHQSIKTLFIDVSFINLQKFTNQIFIIKYKDGWKQGYCLIKKHLNPFLYYILYMLQLYNKHKQKYKYINIPYEIYNYIYYNFNFSYNN